MLPVLRSTTDEWPTRGAIEFKSVCLRYRAELPYSLKDISFSVKPREKVRDEKEQEHQGYE